MTTNGDTTNSILSRFTYQTLPRIVGVPTYQTITLAANDLKANASGINSELGGGALGHLALTVPTAVYTTLANVPFVIPVNPGATAPVLGNNATGAQLAANRDTYAANLRLYRLCNNVQNALKTQLLASVDDIYVRTLCNTHGLRQRQRPPTLKSPLCHLRSISPDGHARERHQIPSSLQPG
jgi:hypothetical protein